MDGVSVPETLVTGGLPRRRQNLSSSTSQLVSPHLLRVFVLPGPQLVLGELAVFISVLVVEHVLDHLVGGDPWTKTTFALLHLELDEG